AWRASNCRGFDGRRSTQHHGLDRRESRRAQSGMGRRSMTLQEKCGVVAIAAHTAEPARLAFFALYALQHRGQESAGICTADGESLHNLTGMGLVSQVFLERDLAKLGGSMAIGHTRYSTTGSSRAENAQPLVVSSSLGSLALAHNGNL